ncbi:MAG: tRNA lysidine(34) synthetase TilS [Anaerolineales bacterium]
MNQGAASSISDASAWPGMKMPEAILREACQLKTSQPVVVGVSGGADSLCLLGVLHEAGYPLVVAHFNHRLRPAAEQEQAAVETLARSLGLDFVGGDGEVAAFAESEGLSIEQAARTLRYRFLFAVARRRNAQAVAVGHTADDQVETVLMHFLRGSGLSGLRGMTWRTYLPSFDPDIPLVRPLLGLWRADTEAYCRAHGLQPLTDPSNADPAYFRNRVRHEVLPLLETYNPRLRQALWRMATALQGDEALLAELVEAAWQRALRACEERFVAFDRAALDEMPRPLRRNLFRRAAGVLRPGLDELDFASLERAADLRPANLTGGLRLFVEGERLYLAACEADLPMADYPQIDAPRPLLAPETDLGGGWKLALEQTDRESPLAGDEWPPADPWAAWLDAEATGEALLVRPRCPGDRFQPLGMETQVKLQDFFVNVKLPRRARSNWPLVCAGERIVWVPGFRLAHTARVTRGTRRLLKLHLYRL